MRPSSIPKPKMPSGAMLGSLLKLLLVTLAAVVSIPFAALGTVLIYTGRCLNLPFSALGAFTRWDMRGELRKAEEAKRNLASSSAVPSHWPVGHAGDQEGGAR